MEGLLGFAKDILSSQPIMQAFAGAAAIIIVGALVLRGAKDRDPAQHAPGPGVAPGSMGDIPPIFAQGPQVVQEALREVRDSGRRLNETVERILDVARDMQANTHRQAEALERIEREQAIANRAAGRRGDER